MSAKNLDRHNRWRSKDVYKRQEYEKKFTSQAMTEKLEALYEAQIKK